MLVVEDIIDTGLTLSYLLTTLRARGPGVARGLHPARPERPPDPAARHPLPRVRDPRRLRRRLRPRPRRALPEPPVHRGGRPSRRRLDEDPDAAACRSASGRPPATRRTESTAGPGVTRARRACCLPERSWVQSARDDRAEPGRRPRRAAQQPADRPAQGTRGASATCRSGSASDEAQAIAIALQGIADPSAHDPRPDEEPPRRGRRRASSASRSPSCATASSTRWSTCRRNGSSFEVSSRPSDAIALAVRSSVPIFAAEEVLAEASIDVPDEEEQEVERFRSSSTRSARTTSPEHRHARRAVRRTLRIIDRPQVRDSLRHPDVRNYGAVMRRDRTGIASRRSAGSSASAIASWTTGRAPSW